MITLEADGSKGYSFQLDLRSSTATTFWEGQEEEQLPLREAPVHSETGLYVNGEDAKLLLGLSIDWFPSRQNFYLFRNEYGRGLQPLTQASEAKQSFSIEGLTGEEKNWNVTVKLGAFILSKEPLFSP